MSSAAAFKFLTTFNYRPDSAKELHRGYFAIRWLFYFYGVSWVVICCVCDVVVPKIIQWTIDLLAGEPIPAFLSGSSRETSFQRVFGFFLAILLVQLIGRKIWRLTLGQETHRVASYFKGLVWDKSRFISRQRLETDLNTGTLMNVANSDVGSARMNFGWTLVGLIDSFSGAFIVVAMFTIDLELAIWTLVLVPLVPWAVYGLAAREYRLHKIAQESLSILNELCSQAVSTVKLQRLTQTSEFWRSRLDESATDLRTKRFEVVRTSLWFVLVLGLVPLSSYCILFYLGIQKVALGMLTPGGFVAMQGYIYLLKGPVGELGFVIAEWQRGMASTERIVEVFGEPAAPGLKEKGVSAVESAPFVYEVSDLAVSFGDGQRIFEGVGFKLRAGERLGVSGQVGAGKSALVDVLAGFRRDFRGVVNLYGRDIREYSHTTLRAAISTVPQKPFLFADTIRNNILLNRALGEDEIWHWLEVAGLADEVRGFPGGLDSPLGEWGINLSGGQKQRLTLTRALAGRPRTLLLDDCLSAVDTVTEERILSALDRELENTTLIWIAHRRSTLRFCNQYLELGA